MKEQIEYVEFYLAGDCIFACQKSWFPNDNAIDCKKWDLADLKGVAPMLITYATVIREFPIPNILDKLLEGTGVGISNK